MNCQEFSTYAAELARGRVMEAAARDGALGHADACGPCAARLARERTLSAALRLTAEGMSGEEAPARVGAAVLAAFRESRGGGRVPALAPAAGGSAAAARVSAARFRAWPLRALAASAVAASLVVAATVARRAQFDDPPASRGEVARGYQPAGGQSSGATNQTTAQTTQTPQTTRTTQAARQTGEARTTPGVEEGQAGFAEGSAGVEGVEGRGARRAGREQRAAGGNVRKRGLPEVAAASFEVDGGRALLGDEGAAFGPAGASLGAAETEALTEFVPVAAGANTGPLDGGQLVRVKVPRAALASFGLPVDAQRADETVKADLLLAHDGTARAIRLVR